MLGLLNTVLSRGGSLLTYVKDGLVMANRFLTPPKLTFPVDASAEFNGTSDYIDTASLPLDTFTNFTISGWFYIDNLSTTRVLLGFGSSSSNFPIIVLEAQSSGVARFFVRDSGSSSASLDSSAGAITTGKWYFLAGTRNGNDYKGYLDGSLTANVTTSAVDVEGELDLFGIGRLRRLNPSGYMDGNLANVAIWNRALSSDEINSVMWKTYEQVSTTEKSGLQAWYKLSADEVLSGDSTATLTTYANANSLTFEAPACVQTALNGLPDITDARLYSANYDIRVSADGGNVESLSCVETELNAIL
jgi:hypothetical protein